jgi:hypothetical protein
MRFVLAVEAAQVEAPPAAHDALNVLWRACVPTDEAAAKRKPRDRLNRAVGQARRRNPRMFRDLWRWTRTPAVGEACKRLGAGYAWLQCRRAFAAIARGVTAHQALGMTQAGNPATSRFTRYQAAAFDAERLIQAGATVEYAVEQARQAAGLGINADRDIRRNRHPILWADARRDKPAD